MFAGCPAEKVAPPPVNALPFEGITLNIAVVGDPAIAAGIERIANEWKVVTGSTLEVVELPSADVSEPAVAGDVLIIPPQMIGKLAEANLLAEIPDAMLDRPAYEWRQVFEVLQSHETGWAGRTIALPLGSPVFTLIYRRDLLNKLDLKPPTTWGEYQSLAETLFHKTGLPCIEPLAGGWAGRLLLARAASYAKYADNYSTLFRTDTMDPLIAGPPFERALSELVASAKLRRGDKSFDSAAARHELLAGRAAMAISWASAADGQNASVVREQGIELGFAELPGSREVYDHRRQKWARRVDGDATHVPMIAADGRLACVSKQSEFTEPAIELIAWLSGPRWSAAVASRSPMTTLFRDSHLKDAQQWCDLSFSPAEAEAYGETIQRALERSNFLAALRIPAADQYMAALDQAVFSALAGEQSPQAALEAAAREWQQITQQVGRELQRRAYQHSNGLEL
jgi:multiple sugar transport system substrate-binding protein